MITDHKPLVAIFGDCTLDEIANTRLFRLKQRTLPWRFAIMHMPGASNQAADAASCYPSSSASIDTFSTNDMMEHTLVAAIQCEAAVISSLPWSRIVEDTSRDDQMCALLHMVEWFPGG